MAHKKLHWFLPLGSLIAIAAITGCSKNQAAERFTPPPMPVEQAAVVEATVTDRLEAVGTIDAIDAITVVSEIDALVRDLPFHEGASIRQGDLIAQLDDTQLQAQLSRAEAVRDQKKITYDRIESLADKGAVAPQELDDATAALKIAEAELGMIKAQLDKTRIVASFSGMVGSRRVSPGAFVRIGNAITDLTQLSELKVTFAAPERYYPLLKVKSPVTVTTTAFPGVEFKGTIEVIEPVVDKATRSVRIIAHVNNPDLRLRPGMSANVSAALSSRQNALMIPDEAIFAEGSRTLVFAVNPDSTVTRVPVELGARQSRLVEVLNGLKPGMNVVQAGHQKLFEGAKVMPIPHQTAADAAGAGGTK